MPAERGACRERAEGPAPPAPPALSTGTRGPACRDRDGALDRPSASADNPLGRATAGCNGRGDAAWVRLDRGHLLRESASVSGDEPGQQMLAATGEKCEWRRDFSLAGDTASTTRRRLRSSLGEYLIRERLNTAVLLVEEIVGSSSRRALANQSITVLLAFEADLLRVEVIEPEQAERPAAVAEIRRPTGGLMIVARNARDSGMTLGPPVRVWFEV